MTSPTLNELQILDINTKIDTERSSEATIDSHIDYMEDIIEKFDNLCKDQKDIYIVNYVDAFIKCMSIVCNNLMIVRKRGGGYRDVIDRYYHLRDVVLDGILKTFNRGLRIKYYINAPLSLSDNLLYATTFDFMKELHDRYDEIEDRHDGTKNDITDDMYQGIKRIQKVINKHKIQLDADEDKYATFSARDKKLHDEDRFQISETQKVIDHIIDHFLGESNQNKYYKDFPNIPRRDQQETVAGGRFTRRKRKNKHRKNRNKSRR